MCCLRRYEPIDRFVQGLSALFLALRRRPVIRYQRGSAAVQRLADSLYQLTYKQVRGRWGGQQQRSAHQLKQANADLWGLG